MSQSSARACIHARFDPTRQSALALEETAITVLHIQEKSFKDNHMALWTSLSVPGLMICPRSSACAWHLQRPGF